MIELDQNRDDANSQQMKVDAGPFKRPKLNPAAGIMLSPRLLSRFLRPESKPRWAFLFITHSCNINCAYCQVPEHPRDEIPMSEWTRVLDRLDAWGVAGINILGGEPLLRKELVNHLLDRAAARRLLTTLTTNGTLLNEQRIDELAQLRLSSLQISIDSLQPGPKYHSKAVELLKYTKRRGIIPVVCTVASASNVDALPSMAESLAEHDIMFSCGLYQSIGRSFSVRRPELMPSPDAISQSFGALIDIKKRYRRVRNSDFSLRHYQNLDSQRGWHCNSQHDAWVCVDSDGSLMVCQEHPTKLKLLDVEMLSSAEWRKSKAELAESCPGCSYLGYIDEENVRGLAVLRELPGMYAIWRTYFRPGLIRRLGWTFNLG